MLELLLWLAFVEKINSGRRALVGAKSERFDASLWREDGLGDSCVGGGCFGGPPRREN